MVNINIPLPDSCASCPLSVRHFGKLYCPPLDGRVGNEGKDSRCPLVDMEGRGDLISRADALSCFHDWIDQRGDVHTADEMPEFQRIEQLPSAQPKQKVGKWIPCDVDSRGMTNMFVCSKCGSFTSLPILKYANAMEYDFCPNCGADMRGEQND